MALQFNEGAYGRAYEQGQQNEIENRQAPIKTLESVAQQMIQMRQLQLQQQQADMQKKEFDRKQKELNAMDQPLLQRATLGNTENPTYQGEGVSSLEQYMNTPTMGQSNIFQSLQNNPQQMQPSSSIDLFHQINPHIQDPRSMNKPQMSPMFSGSGQQQPGQDKFRPTQQMPQLKQPGTKELTELANDPTADPSRVKRAQDMLINMQKISDLSLDRRLKESEIELKQSQSELQRKKYSNLDKTGSEFGKPPNGYRWLPDGSLEMIPGGPADQKEKHNKEKTDLAIASQREKANLIINKIDQALLKVSPFSAGAGSFLKSIPLTDAKNLSADLDTIKALLGFEQLAEMKNQSRAGASGLGQLSDREMTLLTSARANLDQSQDSKQLSDRLNEIKTHFNNWLKMEEGINPYENGQREESVNNDNFIYKKNIKTGARIKSSDGGKTWMPAN